MSAAAAHGLTTVDIESGRILDAYYPDPRLGPEPAGATLGTTTTADVRGVRIEPVTTVIQDLGTPPADVADAYLRLHLLSHRLVRPHGLNLEGIFGVLPNVAWTNRGPVDPAALDEVRLRARALDRPLSVTSVDKFPRMTDYVVPSGVVTRVPAVT